MDELKTRRGSREKFQGEGAGFKAATSETRRGGGRTSFQIDKLIPSFIHWIVSSDIQNAQLCCRWQHGSKTQKGSEHCKYFENQRDTLYMFCFVFGTAAD
mmetsp:Transcript_37204/g.73203  ORF Transcript_37204/g.73203 Transcript_37204/m.73203 type:complete len:100 (-) Transcript_37204:309-608(-)